MHHSATILAPCLALLAACAGARPSPGELAPGPSLLRAPELARVRCLLLAPLEGASDAPLAAGAATRALEAGIDRSRTQALPVAELRALLAGTPLELSEGVPGVIALELAELLGADGALYGAVEGRSRGREPGMVVTLRLLLAGSRELVFAGSAQVVPSPGEPVEAATRRAVIELARPALDRLGAQGSHACFSQARRDSLRAAAVALEGAWSASTPAVAEESSPASGPSSLRTPRQREWARRLGEHGQVILQDVRFAERTADLVRDAGLADLALVLTSSPSLTVRLVGYVDDSGDPAADNRLSLAMAQAAGRRLTELGVEPGRIGLSGRGGESPLVPNFTARGRAANRRVEATAPR